MVKAVLLLTHKVRSGVKLHRKSPTLRLLMYENEFVSLESCTYIMTSARSVFLEFRSTSGSYLEPNSCNWR